MIIMLHNEPPLIGVIIIIIIIIITIIIIIIIIIIQKSIYLKYISYDLKKMSNLTSKPNVKLNKFWTI